MYQASRTRGEHKIRLSAHDLFPGRVSNTCTPEVIIIPRVSSAARSAITPVGSAEVLGEAMRQSGPFLVDETTVRSQVGMLKSLIEQCRCYRLDACRDLIDEPDRFSDIVMQC